MMIEVPGAPAAGWDLSTGFSTIVEKRPYEGPHPRWKNVPPMSTGRGTYTSIGSDYRTRENREAFPFFCDSTTLTDGAPHYRMTSFAVTLNQRESLSAGDRVLGLRKLNEKNLSTESAPAQEDSRIPDPNALEGRQGRSGAPST